MIFNHLPKNFIAPDVLADEKSSEEQIENFLKQSKSSPRSVLLSPFRHRQTPRACHWETKQLGVANPRKITQVKIRANQARPPRQPVADLGLLTMLQPSIPLTPLGNSGPVS